MYSDRQQKDPLNQQLSSPGRSWEACLPHPVFELADTGPGRTGTHSLTPPSAGQRRDILASCQQQQPSSTRSWGLQPSDSSHRAGAQELCHTGMPSTQTRVLPRARVTPGPKQDILCSHNLCSTGSSYIKAGNDGKQQSDRKTLKINITRSGP